MLRFLVSVACLLLSSPPIARAWAQANPLQDVPDQLVRIEEGFSLDLQGGFQLGKQQDGYYLLGSRTIPGLVLVRAMPGLTAAELNKTLRSGYSDPTVQLTPEGPVTELSFQGGFGKLAEVSGSVLEGEVEGLLAGYLREGGGGLLLFAVTSPEQWPELNSAAEQMARSVRLFVPDPQELIRLWTERLAGFKLVRAPAANETRRPPEGAATREYFVCSNGAFLFEQGAAAARSEAQPPNSAADAVAGNWEIVPARLRVDLIFRFENGKSESYRLSRSDEETYLEEQRYFVLPNDRCR
ncbi:MAG: hypothetical protein WD733_09680 [Bryobacterales bacterium]